MELFLNLCWLTLLLPAYLLWRQRVSSEPWTRASFVIICTLGCALVLLFPVISASDDLHAIGQAIEESERSFRNDGRCACALHSVPHDAQPALPASTSAKVAFERLGTVLRFSPHSLGAFFASRPIGRAPPAERTVAL